MSKNPLNEPQRLAVRYLDGPCLVIAGAGSGKTRVITQKIAHLVDNGQLPNTIAAITFTNKAASEMAERLKPLLSKVAAERQPLVCTFHSLGVRMLRSDGHRLGLKRNFSILDSDDATGILQQTLGSTDRRAARDAASRISLWKNALVDPDQAAAESPDEETHRIARAYRDYAATLNAYQAVDFDDLIRLPVALLRQDAEALASWREKLRYLLIDEYQDTNACQYELMRLITGPRAAFTAVGDDDQSIYGWRGATLANLDRLSVDYPQLRVIKLEQNYRSSQAILTAANALISANPKLHEKRLFSELGQGDPVRVLPCDSDEIEADDVVMRLQAMKFEKRCELGDFAILYRSNQQARVLEKALRREKLPYQMSGGQSFFDRAEIRDLMAWLRLLANDDDDPAFIRAITCPRRGIGAATLSALGVHAGRRQVSMFAALFETGFEQEVGARALADLREFGEFINRMNWRSEREAAGTLLDELLVAIDYHGHLVHTHDDKAAALRWQNVCDFTEWVKKRAEEDGATLRQMAQSLAILTQLEKREDGNGQVRLTTIHAAKGLEYPHVFIIGCEEGLLPHHGGKKPSAESDADDVDDADSPAPVSRGVGASARSSGSNGSDGSGDTIDKDAARIEEERRLMYVAVTRAQRSLHLSWCRSRKRARTVFNCKPSRFIAEMLLQPQPAADTTITGAAARGRLGALKDMLNKSRQDDVTPTV